MLKHILTGQPSSSSSAASRLHHHHHEYLHQPGAPAQAQPGHPGFPGHGLPASARASGRAQSSADVYDSVGQQRAGPQFQAGPQFHGPRHPLNHSQLSVNNLAQRLNASHHSQHALNLSTLSTSKHSVNSVSPVVGAHLANYAERGRPGHGHPGLLAQLQQQQQQQQQQQYHQQHQQHQQQQQHGQPATAALLGHGHHPLERAKVNGGLDISRLSRGLPSQPTPSPAPAGASGAATATTATTATTAASASGGGPSVVPLNVSWSSSSLSQRAHKGLEAGVREVLTSLGLLCLVSLLLALLSLTFLIRMASVSFQPNSLISPEEFAIVYDVTVVLCSLALCLNLCCLLICAIQFLFAVKLVKPLYHGQRTNKYLQKSSISRVCAIGGFFISIPVFLTGMILYTFIQFQSTSAIVTSVIIGLGILFCGCALVHTVFVWQKEKTNAMKALRREQYEAAAQLQRQQQQQQQHHHQQQQQQQQTQPRPLACGAASRLAASDQLVLGNHSRLGLNASGAHQQPHHHQPAHQHPQQHPLALHGHRHVSMSPPPLLMSSPSVAGALHAGALNASQRSQLLGPASPPASPGDHSPTGGPGPGLAAAKQSRSQQQQQQREAAGSVSPGLPAATLDLSSAANTNSPHELSTLV